MKKAVMAVAVAVLSAAVLSGCGGDDNPNGGGNGGGGGGGRDQFNPNVTYGSLTDSRDDKKYHTVRIGTQTWMAENLNFDASGSVCYENSPDSCAKYGRLYDWATVMDGASSSSSTPSGVQGVCPAGWHLPSHAEWTVLTDYVGDPFSTGTKLKSTSGWEGNGNGTDDYGFSALPGGIGSLDWKSEITFISAGSGLWWSASEYDETYAWWRGVDRQAFMGVNYQLKTSLFAARCVKDEA